MFSHFLRICTNLYVFYFFLFYVLWSLFSLKILCHQKTRTKKKKRKLKDKSVLMFCNMMTTSLKVLYLLYILYLCILCFFILYAKSCGSIIKKSYVQSFWKFLFHQTIYHPSYVFISESICHLKVNSSCCAQMES